MNTFKVLGFAAAFALTAFTSAAQQGTQQEKSADKQASADKSACCAVTAVQDARGEDVGRIAGIIIDPQHRQVRYIMVAPHGQQEADGKGLMPVPMHAVGGTSADNKMQLVMTKDELSKAPRHDAKDWNAETVQELARQTDDFFANPGKDTNWEAVEGELGDEQNRRQQAANQQQQERAQAAREQDDGLGLSEEARQRIQAYRTGDAESAEGQRQDREMQQKQQQRAAQEGETRRQTARQEAGELNLSPEAQQRLEAYRANRGESDQQGRQARSGDEQQQKQMQQQQREARQGNQQDAPASDQDLDRRIEAAIERYRQEHGDLSDIDAPTEQQAADQRRQEQAQRDAQPQRRNTAVSGQIEKISSSEGQPLQLTLKADSGKTYTVDLGPQEFIQDQDIQFNQGDNIVVVGRIGTSAGEEGQRKLVAQRVWKTGPMLELRDQQGQPQWQVSKRDN